MRKFEGIFPALQAPFQGNGEIDLESMRRQVEHSIAAGTHGLVFPVMAGELFYLSESERQTLVEVTVETAAGRVPVVVGVTAPSVPQVVEKATHAKKIGADAVIALPPFFEHATESEMRAYYQAISDAAEMPVFIQHSWPGMSPEFLAGLMRDFENVCYIKEETPPSGLSISAAINAAGQWCLGVFGGSHGYWMIPEMRRGACGFVPAAQCTEVYVAIWNSFQRGDEPRAREIYADLRPFLDLLSFAGLPLCKEVLVRRGVIQTAKMRKTNTPVLDQFDTYELDLALKSVEKYFLA